MNDEERQDMEALIQALEDSDPPKRWEAAQDLGEYREGDAALQYQLGATHFSLENYAEAGQAFQKSAALSQDKEPTLYKDAMFNLGVAYIKIEDFDAAIATIGHDMSMN